jgi:hypothetical protein
MDWSIAFLVFAVIMSVLNSFMVVFALQRIQNLERDISNVEADLRYK